MQQDGYVQNHDELWTQKGARRARLQGDAMGTRVGHRDAAVYQTGLSMATTGTLDTDTMAEWWRAAGAYERRQFVTAFGLDGAVNVKRDALSESAVDLCALYRPVANRDCAGAGPFRLGFVRQYPATMNAANWKWRLPFALVPMIKSELAPRIAALRAIGLRTRGI